MAALSVNSRCKVKVDGKMDQTSEVNICVCQGDNIPPLLFNISLEEAIQKVKNSNLE